MGHVDTVQGLLQSCRKVHEERFLKGEIQVLLLPLVLPRLLRLPRFYLVPSSVYYYSSGSARWPKLERVQLLFACGWEATSATKIDSWLAYSFMSLSQSFFMACKIACKDCKGSASLQYSGRRAPESSITTTQTRPNRDPPIQAPQLLRVIAKKHLATSHE